MELGGLDIQILRAITNRKRRVAVEFAGAEFILSGPAVRRELGKDSDIDILGILP
jgi:predicted nucleotidyltransferase